MGNEVVVDVRKALAGKLKQVEVEIEGEKVQLYVRPESDALQEAILDCRRQVQDEFSLTDKEYEAVTGRIVRELKKVKGKGEVEGERIASFTDNAVVTKFINLSNHQRILHMVCNGKGEPVFRSLEEVRELPSSTVDTLLIAMAQQTAETAALPPSQPHD